MGGLQAELGAADAGDHLRRGGAVHLDGLEPAARMAANGRRIGWDAGRSIFTSTRSESKNTILPGFRKYKYNGVC